MAATRTSPLAVDDAPRRFDARTALRWGAPSIYVGALVGHCIASHFSLARDELLLWIAGALLAGSITQPKRFLSGLVLEWAPFAGILFAYDLLRGYADGLLFPAHLWPQIDFDRFVFGGTTPSVWLQDHLWHGPAHVRWYDYACWGVYLTHFLFTLVFATVLWIFAHRHFRRYAAMVVALSIVGFATYVLFPAVPPWMASGQGHLAPLDRIVPIAWSHIHVFSFDTLFQTGSQYANDVAAMPSLHAAFSLLIALYLGQILGRRWVRAALLLYPLAMGFALVYSGEHYFLDVLMGWIYAVVVVVAVNRAADRLDAWRQSRSASDPAASSRSSSCLPALPSESPLSRTPSSS